MKPVSDPNKNKTIKEIYYNDETGYKSIIDTHKLAKEKNGKLTFDYVKKWFKDQGPIQIQSSRISKTRLIVMLQKPH